MACAHVQPDSGKGACALCIARVTNVRLRPSPQEVHRGGTGLKPIVAPSCVRGESMNQQET